MLLYLVRTGRGGGQAAVKLEMSYAFLGKPK
jgi:hypothetical protein